MQKDCGLGVLPLTTTNLMGDSTRSIGLVGGNTDSLVRLTTIFLIYPFGCWSLAIPRSYSTTTEIEKKGTGHSLDNPWAERSADHRESLKQIWPELAPRVLPWLVRTCGIPRQSIELTTAHWLKMRAAPLASSQPSSFRSEPEKKNEHDRARRDHEHGGYENMMQHCHCRTFVLDMVAGLRNSSLDIFVSCDFLRCSFNACLRLPRLI
jgi:hypothetical protein